MKTQNADRSKARAFGGSQILAMFFTLFLLVAFAGYHPASAQSLDGKNFLVKMYDTNMPDQTDEDVLTFKSGTFDSQACQQYGYQPTSYKVKKQGKSTAFTAISKSHKEGEMHWEGTITNDQIQGTAVWKKDGQKDIRYKFEGKQKNT